MEIKDKHIQPTKTEDQKKLSAMLCVDSFFYGLYDTEDVLSRTYSSKYQDAIPASIPVHTEPTSCIGIFNDMFTIIPLSEENDTNEDTGISNELNIPFQNSFSEPLPKINGRILYAIHVEQEQFYTTNFPNVRRVHFVGALINHLSHDKHSAKIHVSNVNDKLVLLAFDQGKMLMVNIFHHSDKVSLLYYVQLISQQYLLSPENLTIELSGIYSNVDEVKSFLDPYFFRILDVTDQDSPSHKSSFPLDSILQCAS